MKHTSLLLALLASFSGAAALAAPGPAPAAASIARQQAPLDGWAAQAGGTRGGADAGPADILTVSTPAQLRAALAHKTSRIIQVDGLIDMSEGRPFASSEDQAKRGLVRLGSNTTLVGLGPNAGFINAHVQISKVSQVIVRNLRLRNPCDVAPTWDPKDGAQGNWNADFDAISISGARHVWIDHNSFTDAPVTDDQQPVENGKHKQCHDGALDISSGSDFVTVSYNHFALHQKNTLIGSSDKALGDSGHLRVTFSNNLFENVASRAPRVRFGQVHLFNNYHVGDRKHPVYQHEYGVGVAKQARIVSHANAFDIAGARSCTDAVRPFETEAPDAGVFTDTGSLLNGRPLAPCGQAATPAWTVPYPFTPRPADTVRAHVLANAGAGKINQRTTAPGCPTADFLVCDSFGRARSGAWEAVSKGAAPAIRGGMLQLGGTGPLLALSTSAQLNGLAPANAFVEARVRPSGPAGGARQFYLVGRYVDARNWVGAGVDLPASGDTVNIQLVKMQDGVLSRLKNVPRARLPQARFAMLRLEMTAGMLAVYLDGEKISTAPQPAFAQERARIGLYSQGSFELDDLRAGVPGVQPARLAPALAAPVFTAQAGDPAQRIGISAVASDGVTRLGVTARSSNPAVASVSVGADGLTIVPKAAGVAEIVLSSVDDPALQSTMVATITAPFSVPGRTLALGPAVSPAPQAHAVPADTPLRITFDGAPGIGSAGSVRIHRQSDGALVDIIRVGEEVRDIGYPGQPRSRHVRMHGITVSGNTALIRPHSGKLAYGTEYYVVVGDGVFTGATLKGQAFHGIGQAGAWAFRTAPAAPRGTTLSVDDDGPADFRTVQGALNHAMSAFDKATPVTIEVRNGRYEELLLVLGKDRLTIRGESRDGVVIHATNSDGINPGSGTTQGAGSPSFSGGRSLLMVEDADLLTLDNLTLRNTTLRSNTRSAQAETVYFNSDGGRLVAKNASFFSEQDTIQVKGYAWFYRTLIEGNVDFIWGANRAALFEESELRSVGDSANPASGGYVVQARTVSSTDPGFVFLNSSLTHGPGPKGNGVPPGATYLARSPGTASTWDNVAFIHCRMGEHVAPAGWAGAGVHREPAPNPVVPNAAHGWREHGTMDLAGKRLDLSGRAGGYLLSADEVKQRFGSRAVIFSGFAGGQGWNPAP
ncbi:pectinesterase family protein [Massilia niabensis]|uniref:Pectinesterase family protein n=1 Tax=Massilia niabensis TaxID=544910 RepID=A0ABW0L9Z2_9BURK